MFVSDREATLVTSQSAPYVPPLPYSSGILAQEVSTLQGLRAKRVTKSDLTVTAKENLE